MKKLLKVVTLSVLGVLILSAIFAGMTQTRLFKNWLKNKLISYAHANLNGTLSIGALKGNLFTKIELQDISVQLDGDSVISIRNAVLRYHPLSILGRKISVGQIRLEGPAVKLVRNPDHTWNLSNLLKSKEGEQESQSPDLILNNLHWKFELPRIQIAAGEATFEAKNAAELSAPRKISDLQLEVGLWLAQGHLKVSLRQLSFATQKPDLKIQTVQSDFTLNPDSLEAPNFELETESSKISSALGVKDFDNPILNIMVKGYPISLAELRKALPTLKVHGNSRFDLEAKGRLDALWVKSKLWLNNSSVAVAGRLQTKHKPYEYDLQGQVSNLDLSAITNDPDLSSLLTFEFGVKGQGTEWGHIKAEYYVEVDSSRAKGVALGKSVLKGSLVGDTLSYSADLLVQGASLTGRGKLLLAEANPAYSINGRLENFDLSQFPGAAGLTSQVNLNYRLKGQGLSAGNLAADLVVHVLPSSLSQVPIDSAVLALKMSGQKVQIRDFAIHSPLCKVAAQGVLSIKTDTHLKFEVEFKDFSVLSNTTPADSLWGKGVIRGRVEGLMDSLTLHSDFDFANVGTENLDIARLSASLTGLLARAGNTFAIQGKVAGAEAYGMAGLNSKISLQYAGGRTQFQIAVNQKDGVKAAARGNFTHLEDTYALDLEDLSCDYAGQNWRQLNEVAKIRYRNSELSVSQLLLGFEDQSLALFGRLDAKELNALTLQLTNIDVSKLSALFGYDNDYAGRLNFSAKLSGILKRPTLEGNFNLENGQYFSVPFKAFKGKLGYENNKLFWKFLLSKAEGDSLLETSGHLPATLAFEPFGYKVFKDAPFEFKISTRGVDISFLQAFSKHAQNISGTLVADVVLSHTLNDIRGVGPVRLINGSFAVRELGTHYKRVNLVLVLKGKQVLINDFRMRSGDGELRIVEGSLALSQENIENFKARLTARNFQLMHNKKMQASVDGYVDLHGSIRAPRFTGALTVNQARIYYPAWLQEETAVKLTESPFFVIPPDSMATDTSGAIRFQKSSAGAERQLSDTEFYKNLRGELSISFPRNTWFRGEEANIEIEGDLELLKEGPDFVLYGSFSAVRGFYELLGNRFKITDGELVFNGDPEPNPELSIEAVHEFREQSGEGAELHRIKVEVTGTQRYPKFKFTLDDQESEQKDILSYLLFGRSFDNLTLGQRNSVSNQTGIEQRATGYLTGQIVRRLTRALGQELSLDMIQIERGKSFADAKVRIGKYVTPDVFVIVSQDFGAEGSQKVEIEYEIPKKILFFNLFLQGSKERKGATGLDVFWKIEW